MAFPSPPHQLNDPHTEAGVTWYWDGTKWKRQPTTVTDAYINLGDPDLPGNTVDGNILPSPGDPTTQLDLNTWTTLSLGVFDNMFDANGDLIAAIHYGTNEPGNYSQGSLWYKSDTEVLLIYSGVGWVNTTKSVYQSGGQPSNAGNGDLWYNNTGGEEQLFVYNALTNTWLPTGPKVAVGQAVDDLETTVGIQTGQIQQIQGEVDALKVEKGSLKQYDLVNLTGQPIARGGEMGLSSGNPDDVQIISLSSQAKDGTPTNLVSAGDIVELVDGSFTAKYLVSAWDNNFLTGEVSFVDKTSGMTPFQLGDTISVYTYPQNGQGASIEYVDQAVANFVPKTGGTFTGKVYYEEKGSDSCRLYMKDQNGTNLTLFPSGLVQTKNTFRVNKDSGDAYQVKDAAGSSVKMKISADGHIETPRVFLTGPSGASNEARVIDVKQGQSGRLAYNNSSRLNWGSSNVWIGTSAAAGDSAVTVNLDLQNNPIKNVSTFELKHQGSAGKKFVIRGETPAGDNKDDFFYSYKNSSGTLDAMNYNGKMDSNSNLVNKKYVDDKVATVDGFTPGDRVAVSGGNSDAKSGGFYYSSNKLFYKV